MLLTEIDTLDRLLKAHAGLSRWFLRSLHSTWPDAGFHALLVRQTWNRLKRHPLSPLPMFRL